MTTLVPGGAAVRAGLARGDVLTHWGERVLTTSDDLVDAVTQLRGGDEAVVRLVRDDEALTITVSLQAVPLESDHVELREVSTTTGRLRVLETVPTDDSGIALLYLQSADWSSCDYALRPRHPVRGLLHGLTARGVRTFRVERSGCGDSEGPPCTEVDWATELAGYHEALTTITAEHDAVYVFGNSLGGMVAPLLRGVAGVIVFGTSAASWSTCLAESYRRQREDDGLPVETIADEVAALDELHRRVLAVGESPSAVVAERPELSFPHIADEHCHGRTLAFFRQLEAVDLHAAWQAVHAPVLALVGSEDRVCVAHDAEEIASLANGTWRLLDGVDHGLAAPGAVETVVEATMRWLDGLKR